MPENHILRTIHLPDSSPTARASRRDAHSKTPIRTARDTFRDTFLSRSPKSKPDRPASSLRGDLSHAHILSTVAPIEKLPAAIGDRLDAVLGNRQEPSSSTEAPKMRPRNSFDRFTRIRKLYEKTAADRLMTDPCGFDRRSGATHLASVFRYVSVPRFVERGFRKYPRPRGCNAPQGRRPPH